MALVSVEADLGDGIPMWLARLTFPSAHASTVGVSDMTLLSTISNDSVNDNLQKRFENAEIYVGVAWAPVPCLTKPR